MANHSQRNFTIIQSNFGVFLHLIIIIHYIECQRRVFYTSDTLYNGQDFLDRRQDNLGATNIKPYVLCSMQTDIDCAFPSITQKDLAIYPGFVAVFSYSLPFHFPLAPTFFIVSVLSPPPQT